MKKKISKFIPLCLMVAFFSFGCAANQAEKQAMTTQPVKAVSNVEKNVYKGKIVGKSNKAKTISIEVGKGDKAKTMMVRFDDNTKGLEHAAKGEAAVITYDTRGKDKYATVIKPKLAKLPEGVTEVKVEELQAILEKNPDVFLVDSRPSRRYDQSYIPGAVSIPVPELKEKKAAVLPEDKDRPIIFYCGGPT